MKHHAQAGPAPAAARVPVPPELSVIVPTYNERENVRPLMAHLARVLDGVPFEVIFIDDNSPDGTGEEVRTLAREDPRCRLISRHAHRGLAGAALEGILSALAPVTALIDGDMQHDERILPQMKALIDGGSCDLVVGTRFGTAGGTDALTPARRTLAGWGRGLARRVLGRNLGDPLSGFFMVRRRMVQDAAARINAEGFKVLVDIVSAMPPGAKIMEIPYQFRPRHRGESKLDAQVAFEFAALLVSKLSGGFLPLRFVLFSMVGAMGIIVHLATVWLVLRLGYPFLTAQLAATLTAMTSNFFLNNEVTHRDRKLARGGVARGLVQFYLVCSVGVVGNVGVASLMYREAPIWWLSALSGALIGTVWNYAVSAAVVWRRR